MTEKLEAIILDWAGTTMDYGCYAPMVVFRDVFAQMGVPITMEEARAPMGAHKKVHIRKITEIAEVRQRWVNQYNREPIEADINKMFELFVPKQLACLANYADLIPETNEVIAELRHFFGLKIGSTTGYTGEMMKLLLTEAEKRGYTPDVSVCSTGQFAVRKKGKYEFGEILGAEPDWNISRPQPHMCNLNAALLEIKQPYLGVKAGDTKDDIREGKNAGMWTIGLATTGNEIGLNEQELIALTTPEFLQRRQRAYSSLETVQPDFIVDSINDVPSTINLINRLLIRGKRPGCLY